MVGCLCIHGFTGSPYEVEPLAEHLVEVTDWDIRMITLPGHEEEGNLKGVLYTDWINTAEYELRDLLNSYKTVYIIGFSMGGIIAGYLAAKYPVKKLVLLSAAAYYMNPKQMLLDVSNMFQDLFRGNLNENRLFQRYKQKIIETPITATREFQRLVKKLRPDIEKIKVPTLIVQGERDGIVPVKSADYLYQTIPSDQKELFFLPNAQHHVCHGKGKEDLFHKVESFLKESNK